MRALDRAPFCFSSSLTLPIKVSNFFGFLWSAEGTTQAQRGGEAARHAARHTGKQATVQSQARDDLRNSIPLAAGQQTRVLEDVYVPHTWTT